MFAFKTLVVFLFSLIGFIFEIKNIIYYTNTSNLVFLILSVIAFSFLGHLLMIFNKKINHELMGKSKKFDFLIPIIYFSMGMSFAMSIPTKILFDWLKIIGLIKEMNISKDISKKQAFRFYWYGGGGSTYGFFLALFCIEIWFWIYMVDKIGWGNILLEIFGSLIIGIYIFVTKNNIFCKLGGVCLVLPFFCMDIVGIILAIIGLISV